MNIILRVNKRNESDIIVFILISIEKYKLLQPTKTSALCVFVFVVVMIIVASSHSQNLLGISVILVSCLDHYTGNSWIHLYCVVISIYIIYIYIFEISTADG